MYGGSISSAATHVPAVSPHLLELPSSLITFVSLRHLTYVRNTLAVYYFALYLLGVRLVSLPICFRMSGIAWLRFLNALYSG